MKFKELYLRGDISFDELDQYVSAWKFSPDNTPLRDWLGITGEEEDVWIEEGEEAFQSILDQQIKRH